MIDLFRPFSNIDEDLEDIEYDHPDLSGHVHLEVADLRQEVISVYQQVSRNMEMEAEMETDMKSKID